MNRAPVLINLLLRAPSYLMISPPSMVHILGSGSIGLLVAWHLRHASVPVTLLLRSPPSVEHIKAEGSSISLDYIGTEGHPRWLQHHKTPPKYKVDVEQAKGCTWAEGDGMSGSPLLPISQLVVATKASDTVAALMSVRSRLVKSCEIMLLQNGILSLYNELHEKVIAPGLIPKDIKLIVGSVTHGAYRTGASHVVQSCTGGIQVAPLDPELPNLIDSRHQKAWERFQLEAQMDGSGQLMDKESQLDLKDTASLMQRILGIPGLTAELVPGHDSFLRKVHLKLAVNCALNPGTALLGCMNNDYTDDPWGQRLVRVICSELFDLFGDQMLGMTSAEELSDFVIQVASGTGRNKNSMLQDVLANRPTEVDYLNGYVAKVAEAQGKHAPVNSLLHTLIKARESLGRGFL